ncbi:hypothetical protein [[Eubacterium] hominis]|uniref:hypothetical protein n=1 Tax=[Eubacterium] hominis TaxID=2764325 RepID=UPI003A4E556C
MKFKIGLIVCCVLGLLVGCTNQSSQNPSDNNHSQHPSGEHKGNSQELGPGADIEQTMPDVVQ